MNVLALELSKYYEEVSPYNFYREIFGEGELDEAESMTKGKYTAIAIEITDKKRKDKNGKDKIVAYRHTVTDDLDMVDELTYSKHFCVMAPISYAGKSRASKNARIMYALGVELDNLIVKDDGQQIGLENLIDRYSEKCHFIPKPTFVVASGTGVHLYYQFEEPLVLFPNTVDTLRKYKEQLTKMIWHKSVTTTHTDDTIQQESIFQGFRMPGTSTKNGDKAIAFRVGSRVSIDYMNSFMYSRFKGTCDIEGTYRSKLLLKDAKEKYPEWYEKVIVNKDKSRKEWALSRNVYDWWLRRINEEASDGHRYFCLKMLAIYAIKCSNYDAKKNPNPVTQEEFEDDAWSLLEEFNSRGKREDNPFTEYDVICAIQVYEDRGMIMYPRNSVAYKSGIEIIPSVPRREKGKRLKQDVHLRRARAVQDIDYPDGEWREGNGRPKGSKNKKYEKKEMIQQYRAEHPEANVTDVARALGISRPTVYKWWNDVPVETVKPGPMIQEEFQKPQEKQSSSKTAEVPDEIEHFDWKSHVAEAAGLPFEELVKLVMSTKEGREAMAKARKESETETEEFKKRLR